MGAAEPSLEGFLEDKKPPRNPLVPVGALMTAGLISFRQGNSQLGQMLMRARVVVQGATVALMVGTAYYLLRGQSLEDSLVKNFTPISSLSVSWLAVLIWVPEIAGRSIS